MIDTGERHWDLRFILAWLGLARHATICELSRTSGFDLHRRWHGTPTGYGGWRRCRRCGEVYPVL